MSRVKVWWNRVPDDLLLSNGQHVLMFLVLMSPLLVGIVISGIAVIFGG